VPGQRAERSAVISVVAIIAGLLALCALTIGYTTWAVNASQHRWCAVIDLLNAAPPPVGAPQKNPSRAYAQMLSRDFHDLKGSLGCGS
jgi:hypothetical protein